MMQFSPVKSIAFAAAATLLAISTSSAVMAQAAIVGPGNTQAGSFSGQGSSGSWPVYGSVAVGHTGVSAGTGSNGAAFVAAGKSSNGHFNVIGANTLLPGELCSELPGTGVPNDCNAW